MRGEFSASNLEVHFGHYVERGFISGGHTQRYAELMRAPGYPKVIPFIHGALLNNANKKLILITDGFFMPK